MRGRYLLLGLLAGTACSDPPLANGPEGPSEGIAFKMKSREKTFEDCIAGRDDCTYIRLDYPEVVEAPAGTEIEPIAQAIRGFVMRSFEEEGEARPIPALLDDFIFDYRTVRESQPGYPHAWFLERKVFVLYQTPTVVSLSFSERSYTGGAHGSETLVFGNFDPRSGEPVTLATLFQPEARERLLELAEREFRKVRQIEDGTSYAEAGFTFENGLFTLTENFAIGDEGLTFYYNPNEIAPYALGPTEIALPWEELEPLLGASLLRPVLP